MNRLYKFSLKIYRSRFLHIVTNTLKVMFPIIVIGSFAQVIKFSFLRPDGFISSTLGSNHWLPSTVITQLTWMMGMVYHSSIDMIALLAAIAMVHYTVKEYDREFKGGALAGGFAFFVLSCRPLENGGFTYDQYLMANGMFIAIIIGYLSGRILLKFNNSYKNGTKRGLS